MTAPVLTMQTQTQPQISVNDGVRGLLERSVIFSLTVGVFGITRRLSTSQIEVDADKDWVGAEKKLLSSNEYERITKRDGKASTWLKTRSLPSPFKRGLYLLPLSLVEEAEAYMKEYETERQALIEAFLDVYERQVEEAQTSLRGIFSSRDYPSREVVRAAFRVNWQYLSLAAPGSLPASLVERERQKIADQWAQAFEDTREILRQQMAQFVDWMVDRMSGADDGKPKVFKAPALEKYQDFLKTFESLNLTDDQELSSLVAQARSLCNGINADQIRSSDRLRAQMREGFEEIKTNLDTLLENKPSRGISFDDVN
jgi:hypothetical protein